MNSLISICVTTYNRKKLLPVTIKSILEQTYKNFEIIIVDDYSTDGTEKLVENEILPLDNRIRYIRHDKNKGLSFGRNTAIFNAKGKYFTFVDDDDTWNTDFLSIFVKYAEQYPPNYIFSASIISKLNLELIEANLKDLLYLGYTPPVASQFYHTEILKKVNGYNTNIKSGVDHDLWLTLGAHEYKIVWINLNLVNVNTIVSDTRLTLNIDKRLRGIENSLIVWNEIFKNKFENSFFNCIEKNYKYNTYRRFAILALQDNNIVLFFKYFLKLPISLLLRDIKRFVLSRILKKTILIHPTFFHCLNFNGKTKITNSLTIKRNNGN